MTDLATASFRTVARGDVIPDDPMYVYDPSLYFEAGSTGLRCICMAQLAAARVADFESILDFAQTSRALDAARYRSRSNLVLCWRSGD